MNKFIIHPPKRFQCSSCASLIWIVWSNMISCESYIIVLLLNEFMICSKSLVVSHTHCFDRICLTKCDKLLIIYCYTQCIIIECKLCIGQLFIRFNPRMSLFKSNLLHMLHRRETKCCSLSCNAPWTEAIFDLLSTIFAMIT
jgi:hypothetical protein